MPRWTSAPLIGIATANTSSANHVLFVILLKISILLPPLTKYPGSAAEQARQLLVRSPNGSHTPHTGRCRPTRLCVRMRHNGGCGEVPRGGTCRRSSRRLHQKGDDHPAPNQDDRQPCRPTLLKSFHLPLLILPMIVFAPASTSTPVLNRRINASTSSG